MTQIKVRCVDKNTILVSAQDQILVEIFSYFSFRPNGFEYMPTFRSGVWDGYVRLFDRKRFTLSIGLFPDLVKFAKDNGYGIEVNENGGKIFEKHDPFEFLSRWNEWSEIEPHKYQSDALTKIVKVNKALVLSPTGSGKSLINYMLLRYILEYTDYKVLVTVPNIQLVEQFFADCQDYELETDIIKVSENIHKLYGKQEAYDGSKRILVSTWQSVYKNDVKFFEQFQSYICDEAHLADAKGLTHVVNSLRKTAVFKVGTTATTDGSKCHAMQLKSLFGMLVKTKTTRELINDGVLTELEIRCLVVDYTDGDVIDAARAMRRAKKDGYQQEVDMMLNATERTDLIVSEAMKTDHNTLILFSFVGKHGHILHEKLNEVAETHGKEILYIDGEVDVKDRETIRAKFKNQNNIVLVASYGTFSTGINVKEIHYLILAHPLTKRIRLLQSIGRVLRRAEGKTKAVLIDVVDKIFDDGGKKHNFVYGQFIKRLEIYENEQFEYDIETASITGRNEDSSQ